MRRHILITAWLVLMTLGFSGCVSNSLIEEDYDPSFYNIARALPDSIEKDTVQFLAFGDTQTGWRAEHKFYRENNWFTWKQLMFPFYQAYLLGNGIVGAANYGRGVPDYGWWSRDIMSRALYKEARSSQSDFTLFLGDAADDGRRGKLWEYFLDDYGKLIRDYPFLPAVGNHEYTNDPMGLANYEAIFDYPRFFVQDMPQAAVFVLNSNFLVDQHGIVDDAKQEELWKKWFVSNDPANPSWLQQQLERRRDRPFKIVAMHHPIVTYAWHFKDWLGDAHGQNLEGKRKQLLNLFRKYGVQVVFSGHEHLYEHDVIRWDGARPHVMHQVISSGGGTPPRNIATRSELDDRQTYYDQQGLNVENLRQETAFHYTHVSIQPDSMVIATKEVKEYGDHDTELMERIVIPRPAPRQVAAEAPSDGADGAAAKTIN